MCAEFVRSEVEGRVGIVRIDRPSKMNAVNPSVLLELEAALAAFEAEEGVRALIITGSERAFIAGADIGGFPDAGVTGAMELTDLTMRVQERLADFPKPVIAAIAGFALGAGLEIALCCDFRLAGENALLGLPEINLGIIPGGGGTQRLPRVVGLEAATRMVLLGEQLKADRALQLGLVSLVVPVAELMGEAKALAEKLAAKPAVAVRAARLALRRGSEMGQKEGLKFEQGLFAMLFGTLDQKEGTKAFLEKRKPEFKGR